MRNTQKRTQMRTDTAPAQDDHAASSSTVPASVRIARVGSLTRAKVKAVLATSVDPSGKKRRG
jgi:hypothetical protein